MTKACQCNAGVCFSQLGCSLSFLPAVAALYQYNSLKPGQLQLREAAR